MHPYVFTIANYLQLFTIAKLWKWTRCPLMDEWIKKMGYISTTEYYSAIKKNELLPFLTAWMDFEDITLSEISQNNTNAI